MNQLNSTTDTFTLFADLLIKPAEDFKGLPNDLETVEHKRQREVVNLAEILRAGNLEDRLSDLIRIVTNNRDLIDDWNSLDSEISQLIPKLKKYREELELQTKDDIKALYNIKKAEEIIPLTNSTIEQLYALATQLLKNENHADSLTILGVTLLIHPDLVNYWIALGICSQLMGDYDAAAIALRFACSLESDNPHTWLLLSECQFKCHNLKGSQQSLTHAEKLLNRPTNDNKNLKLKQRALEIQTKING